VRYWSCRAGSGSFTATREVDELRWLPLEDALRTLPVPRDRPVLERFATDLRDTRAVLVVRHASAGDRHAWAGADADRPLDEQGRRQAADLVALIQAYDVQRAVTAGVLRCRETLAPFTAATGRPPAVEDALGAECFGADPATAVTAVLALATGEQAAAVCSQREVIADLVSGVCGRLGTVVSPAEVGEPGRAAAVVLHVAAEPAGPVLVAWEQLPPP
jgi:phosphohistidine phosphatase SixA